MSIKNYYGVRVANQMGWSKVIRQANKDGGVIITTNGKIVGYVVGVSSLDIDEEELEQVLDKNNDFMDYSKEYYFNMIQQIAKNVLKKYFSQANQTLKKSLKDETFKDKDLIKAEIASIMAEMFESYASQLVQNKKN